MQRDGDAALRHVHARGDIGDGIGVPIAPDEDFTLSCGQGSEEIIERRGELIRITSGLGDRVNTDYAKVPRAAKIEEGILGMIFLHPDYMTREPGGRRLKEGDFLTDLGRRLFRFTAENAEGGSFQFGLLNGAFTPDEVARAAKMLAERADLSVNDGETFDTYVTALREEAAKRTEGEDSLEAVLARRRAGEGGPA